MNRETRILVFGVMLVITGLLVNSTWIKSSLTEVGDLVLFFGFIVMLASVLDKSQRNP